MAKRKFLSTRKKGQRKEEKSEKTEMNRREKKAKKGADFLSKKTSLNLSESIQDDKNVSEKLLLFEEEVK